MELSVKLSAILVISLIAAGSAVNEYFIWRKSSQEQMTQATQKQTEAMDVNSYVHNLRFPEIIVEDQQLAQADSYDPYQWVKVHDEIDGDITSQVEVYGEIDTDRQGEYELRYVVKNSIGLKSTKKIKVYVS